MRAPGWFQVAWAVALAAIAGGILGPEWLAAVLIIPAGTILLLGAWPVVTDKHLAKIFSDHHTSGNVLIGRGLAGTAALIGFGWTVAGITACLQLL